MIQARTTNYAGDQVQAAVVLLSRSRNALGIEVALLGATAFVAVIWELSARRLDQRRGETTSGRRNRVRLQVRFRIRAGLWLVGVAIVIATGPGRTPDVPVALFWTACALTAAAGGISFFYRAYRTQRNSR